MALVSAIVLHAGFIPGLTLLEYLSRVLLHLVAFAGLALLARWLLGPGGVPRFR